jgi:hypothetical protein
VVGKGAQVMTTAASSSTTVAFVFKRKYSDKQVADQTTRDHPTYARLRKRQGLGGQDFVYTVTTGDPQGVGNTFASAQDNDETLRGENFVTQDVLKYAYMTIDGPSMVRNQANQGKIIDLVTRTMDGGLKQLGYEIAFDLFRDGNGLRGRRASISGNVVTLTSVRDADNFKRGMKIIASANANGSSPRTGSAKVTKINRAAKKITLDDASTIASFQDNDYLFRSGTAQNGIDGMGLCTPLTEPTSGVLFRNVERTNDLEALAGVRIDDPTKFPEEQIGDLAVQLAILGKRIDRATVFPTAFQSMVKRLGAKVTYDSPGGNAKVGFQEIMIFAAGYAVPVTADPDILSTEVRVWEEDAHELVYLDSEIVHLIRDDGKIRQRQTGNDGFEVRARSMSNYIQPDPGAHGVGTYQA